MPTYEYKVVPAPTKGVKAKGVKTAEARFSHAVQELMNTLATDGWEYQRAETLPSTERSGLTSTTTEWRNLLVFRRPRENDATAFTPELLPPPEAIADPIPAPVAVRPISASKSGTAPDQRAEPPVTKPAEPQDDDSEDDVENAADAGSISSTIRKFATTRNTSKTDV
jgi:hypothetical protein